MATASWKPTGGTGNWSTASNWTPAPPGPGDSVVIGTTRNVAPLIVTDDVSATLQTLTLAGNAVSPTELAVSAANSLTINGGLVIGANSSIDGTGTLLANGTISGSGSIIADGGLLDLAGAGSMVSLGPVLSIGSLTPSTLEVNLATGAPARVSAINNSNQMLEVGPAGTLNLASALSVSGGSVLMAGGTLSGARVVLGSLVSNGSLSGFGTVRSSLSRSGTGSADTITAVGGTLDIEALVNTGVVLAIDSSAPADLKIGTTAVVSSALAMTSANQTFEIGPAGYLSIGVAETITNGRIRLNGGMLRDTVSLGIGAGATVSGTGTISGGTISGAGTVIASGGLLNVKSRVGPAASNFIIDSAAGSALELSSLASGATVSFAGPTGMLELAYVSGGKVLGFNSTIAGLNVGTSSVVPTNAIDIQAPVTSATLSGNKITVLNGSTQVATLTLATVPAAGARAFVQADSALGGYDVFLASPTNPPSVSWLPASAEGAEGGPIALGAISASAGGNPLASVLVSNIPVGATLTDGAGHSFVAATGTTSVNVLGWNDASLSLTPPNDANVSLSVQATDTLGNASMVANEAVTVDPAAPSVTPASVSGAAGQAIPLALGIAVNGRAGDANALSSVTLSGIPAGATLSNSAGTLATNAGAITFNAAQLAAGALTGLALSVANPGTFTLGVSATEQDADGNISAVASGSETVTATQAGTPPTVTWSAANDGVPAYSHIVVVMEENKGYKDIIGDTTDAPYINSLATSGALLSNYSAITHPSQPNYFALYSGNTWGITSDGTYSEPDPTLDTILQADGKSFIGYVEHPNSDSAHNPWEDFPEGTGPEQSFATFPSGNFASLPTVSFVIPNTNDDMHNGTILQGDQWLKANLDAYAQWAQSNNSLLIVTWDESNDETGGGPDTTNQVPAIFVGAHVTPGVYGTPYNHYSTLSTILGAYGLNGPNNAANVAPIQVFNSGTAAIGVEGQAIGLGTITPTPGSNPLSAVTVSGIPVGATLTDGVHTFTASAGNNSVNVLGWNDGALTITPAKDTNFTLSVQVTDSSGAMSAAVTQAVTVDPLAPKITAPQVSGSPGAPIALNLAIAPNGLAGDGNTMSSVTISGIPVGATLTDGTHTFTASAGSTSIDVLGWTYNALSISAPSGSGSFTLNVSATEVDGEGNVSATTITQQAVTVSGGLTISTSVTGPVVLAPGNNPLTITSTGTVTASGTGKDGVDGPAGTTWTVANSGVVASQLSVGISLASSGTVTNNGSISGSTGIALYGGGGVTNASTGTIVATGTVGAGDSKGTGVYITGVSGQVTNYGIISAGAYGVAMARGGSVTNTASITGGEDGISIQGGAGTVTNSSTISATVDDGIGLFMGGTVTNAAGGLISGYGPSGAGIFATGATGTVANSGTINTVGGRFGILLSAGGSLTNNALGLVEGSQSALFVSHTTAAVSNAGTLAATAASGGVGVDLEAGANLDNQSGGVITGSMNGVFLTGAASTVTNEGTLTGTTGAAIALAAGGSMTNAASGSVLGGTSGVLFSNTSGTLNNSGLINASAASGAGAYLTFGGSVTNAASGVISGVADGIFFNNQSGVVANSGSISGAHAIGFTAGGTLQNKGSGVIVGQNAGVFTTNAAASVANYGSIGATASGAAAADIEAGGTITNFASAAITGTSFGVFVTGGSGSVSNAGSIAASSNIGVQLSQGGSVSNAAGASITGAGYGIVINGSGTVTNAGTISGVPAAVKFSGTGNDRVVVQPGAVFNGAVSGGSGTNTLELAAGSASIDMSPGRFSNFGTVEADAASNWTLVNADTTAPELFQLDNSSSLDVAAALGSNAQFSFLGGSDLAINDITSFGTGSGSTSYAGPLLEGFGNGDAIDLPNFSALGAGFSFDSTSGLLQLTNGGTQAATLSFQTSSLGGGVFQTGTDALGGLLLTHS